MEENTPEYGLKCIGTLPLSQVFLYLHFRFQVQFSSVTQSRLTLCDPIDCSTPGLPVHHQFLELTHTHVHRVGDDFPGAAREAP